MKFKMISLLACIVVLLIVALPTLAKEEKKPLKVIAPDLIVESFEFGKFPDKFGPIDEIPHDRVKFIPCNTAKGYGYSYGYRLKLKTSRKYVSFCTKPGAAKGKNPKKAEIFKDYKKVKTPIPKDGCLYSCWDIVEGHPRGKFWIKGWVEGIELPVIYYTIK